MKAIVAAIVAGLCGVTPVRADLIRVHLGFIEVPHALLAEVMASEEAGSEPAMHARMRQLVKEERAKIVETCILVTRSGHWASSESIREYIYPTEDYPDKFSRGPVLTPEQEEAQLEALRRRWERMVRPHTPTSFETRNLGVTLEIEATHHGQLIDLRIAPEIGNHLGLHTWLEHKDQWGDASIRTPVFETLRTSTGVTLEDGKFGMLGVLTPMKPEGGLMTERKLMLFVKADIISIEIPNEEEEP